MGQTRCKTRRFKEHARSFYLRRLGHTHKGRWIRQLQGLGLTFGTVVLEELDPEDLDLAEMFWIAQLKGMGARLTNATKGGSSFFGYSLTPEQRQRLSAALKGKPKPWLVGRSPDVSTRQKRSRSLGGRAVRDSLGRVYYCVAEAARQTGFPAPSIRSSMIRNGACGRGLNGKGEGISFHFISEDEYQEALTRISGS